jgi:hypothetical protein
MQVKGLTTNELKALIRETMAEILEEYLEDPDEGKEIRLELKQQLLESRQRRSSDKRRISAQEVAQRKSTPSGENLLSHLF